MRSWARPMRLFEARDIYRPIQETIRPYVHSISTCDLGSTPRGR